MGQTQVKPSAEEIAREARIEMEHKRAQDEAFKVKEVPSLFTQLPQDAVPKQQPTPPSPNIFSGKKLNIDALYGSRRPSYQPQYQQPSYGYQQPQYQQPQYQQSQYQQPSYGYRQPSYGYQQPQYQQPQYQQPSYGYY